MTLRQLVILLIAGVLALTGWLMFRPPAEQELAVNDRSQATAMIGQHLAEHFPAEKILLVSNPFTLEKGRDPSVYAFEEAGIAGLKTGIGKGLEIEAIGYPKLDDEYFRSPATFPVDPFSSTPLSSVMQEESFDMLAQQHPDCGVIVSLIGLPIAIAKSDVWRQATSPTFALLLPDLTMLGSIDNVTGAFESGKISCAVVPNPTRAETSADDYTLITRDNVSETVSKHPEVFGFRSLGE